MMFGGSSNNDSLQEKNTDLQHESNNENDIGEIGTFDIETTEQDTQQNKKLVERLANVSHSTEEQTVESIATEKMLCLTVNVFYFVFKYFTLT